MSTHLRLVISSRACMEQAVAEKWEHGKKGGRRLYPWIAKCIVSPRKTNKIHVNTPTRYKQSSKKFGQLKVTFLKNIFFTNLYAINCDATTTIN